MHNNKLIGVYRGQKCMTAIRNKQATGKNAEHYACQYLQAHGLHLIEHNYRCKQGEIDLIMQDQEEVVFVEVRARHTLDFGSAIESVNFYKQKKIIKTALHYLQKTHGDTNVYCRFDIVGIHYLAEGTDCEWVKNAFTADIIS